MHKVLIVNNGKRSINLDKWTLDLLDLAEHKSLMSYRFAERDVVAGSILREWSKSCLMLADDDNLAMTVDLPDAAGCAHGLSCGPSNNEDELDVCKVQAPSSRRQILKIARRDDHD